MNTNYHTIIIGGGAAGFFTAINLADRLPDANIAILERAKDVLHKVRISGGGRCNVTHAQFVPQDLCYNYPRGQKELLGPFNRFMTGDTMDWFEQRGVPLKIEDDGRVFPESNNSQSIIDCFITLSRKRNIEILTSHNVNAIQRGQSWIITTNNTTFTAQHLVIAAGSSPKVWSMLQQLGHRIISAVPSLFTFNIVDKHITQLAGVALQASITIDDLKLESQGALLITHWGFSGPAILKLSAWGARILHDVDYKFKIKINWLDDISTQDCYNKLVQQRSSKKLVSNENIFNIPKRLWKLLVDQANLSNKNWADCANNDLQHLAQLLCASCYTINGKSTFKEEFVTAGGVDLKQINFKTFESKIHKDLYLAGEILNIDAITGGFNFQNAWTGGWLISQAIDNE